MLPLAHRLKKEKEIRRALAGKTRAGSDLLVCRAARNDLGAARFCFAVSKKVSNKAVVRNRLKRRLRAIIARRLARVACVDCVLIARPGLETKSYQEVAASVDKILRRAGILENADDGSAGNQNL